MEKKWWIMISVILLILCLVLGFFTFKFFERIIEDNPKPAKDIEMQIIDDEIRAEIEKLYNNSETENNP